VKHPVVSCAGLLKQPVQTILYKWNRRRLEKLENPICRTKLIAIIFLNNWQDKFNIIYSEICLFNWGTSRIVVPWPVVQ
jgi:hypothetical protein